MSAAHVVKYAWPNLITLKGLLIAPAACTGLCPAIEISPGPRAQARFGIRPVIMHTDNICRQYLSMTHDRLDLSPLTDEIVIDPAQTGQLCRSHLLLRQTLNALIQLPTHGSMLGSA